MILLNGANGDTQEPCTNSSFTSGVGPCGIVESGGYFVTLQCPGLGYQCFPTLTVVNPLTPSFQTLNTATLQGTATASLSGVITDVETYTNVCYGYTSPSACAKSNGSLNTTFGTFSAATPPASNTPSTPCASSNEPSCAVPVSAGQTISVTVTFCFQ